MAEIRRATAGDVDALVEMGRALHAESPEYRDEPFEPEVLRKWLHARLVTTLLADDNAVFVALVAGEIVGVLVAIIVPRWFNSRRIAAELTLYVAPAHRGGRAFPRLVEAYKAWAEGEGATRAALGISTGIHPERTVRAYQRLGAKLDGYNLSIPL